MANQIRVFHGFDRFSTIIKSFRDAFADSDIRCLTITAFENLFKKRADSLEVDAHSQNESAKAAKAR